MASQTMLSSSLGVYHTTSFTLITRNAPTWSTPLSSSPKLRLCPERQRSPAKRKMHTVSVFPEEESGDAIPNSVTYRRSSVHTHYECQTTLENLGLERYSSDLSRSMATSMGISCAACVTATPVGVSYDVSRDRDTGDLRLNGIVKTAVCLPCDRCLASHGARVFSTFDVLLSRKPVEEPPELSIGVALDEEPEPGEPVLDIDLDDKLYFPDDAKSMDLSTYIRDTIHLEIPYFSICSSSCKGLCTRCGLSLNISECTCKVSEDDPTVIYTKQKADA